MKRFTLLRKINRHSGVFYWGIVIVLMCVAAAFIKWVALLIPLVAFFIWRLTHGKLVLRDGEVVLFWGLPGSGKTNLMTKTILENCGSQLKQPRTLYVNPELDHVTFFHYCFERDMWGYFGFRPHSLVAIDEASLNGWDSRDWHQNFNERSLEAWKKIRHFGAAVVLTNQGFKEMDCKIRDSLTSTVYYVENRGSYARAVRMDKDVTFSEDTGLPVEGYRQPTLFERLLDPSAVLYCPYAKYGKYYSTLNPPLLPDVTERPFYKKIVDKKGNFVDWERVPPSPDSPL